MDSDSRLNYIGLLRQHRGLLAISFLAVFTGNLGQSFFIGLIQSDISAELNISAGEFGSIYSAITLFSGFLVMHFGPKIDWIAPKQYALAILAALLLGLILLTLSPWWLVGMLGLALVRICGQGLMTHFGNTLAAREFVVNRGRALGINALAMPCGEIILPPITALLLLWLTWQQVWWVIIIALVLLWSSLYLLVDWPSAPHKHAAAAKKANGKSPIRERTFWMLIPMLLVIPSTLTGIFVYQAQLTTDLGASSTTYILALTAMGLIRFPVALIGGGWIDDLGVTRIARLYLVPYALALLISASIGSDIGIWVLMIGAGISMSMSSGVADSLLVDLWGRERLGRVRSLRSALLVFSTGIAPALFGLLIDLEFQFQTLLYGMLVFLITAALLAQSPIRKAQRLSIKHKSTS